MANTSTSLLPDESETRIMHECESKEAYSESAFNNPGDTISNDSFFTVEKLEE